MLAAMGPGRYSATSAATSSNPVGGERAHEGSHGAALELEDPDRVAALEHRERGVVVEGDGVDVGALTLGLGHEVQGALDDREVAQPRKSILSSPSSSTPCISYWVTMGASAGFWPLSGLRWMGRYSVSGSLRPTRARVAAGA